jgi:hypothetical protein
MEITTSKKQLEEFNEELGEIELTKEYVDSLTKKLNEERNKFFELNNKVTGIRMKYYEKILSDKFLGKCIKYKNSYMKITSIENKDSICGFLYICGVQLCDGKINQKAKITMDTSLYYDKNIEVISEDEFINEFNKIAS